VGDRDRELIVAVLHPRRADMHLLPADVCGRRVALRYGSYTDSVAARNAKASGTPDDVVREIEATTTADTRDALATAEVLLALDLPLDVLVLAPRLRWVQGYGAGVGQLARVLGQSGIRLTTASGIGSGAVAEFVIARVLQVAKRLRELDEQQRRHDWSSLRGSTVRGRTMLLIGLGQIGTEVARLAQAFGIRLMAVRRRPWLPPPDAVGLTVVGADQLHAVLPHADVVVVCAPETDETAHGAPLIGAREVRAMRPGAVLVNVARGSLVDQVAVAEALRDGRLGAAVLDVTEPEPLTPGHELWDLPGSYISPHSSTSGDGYEERLLRLFADNLVRYADGRELVNTVDPVLGY
jgi:phosphoglycerate dehydrogenase-like enzyme